VYKVLLSLFELALFFAELNAGVQFETASPQLKLRYGDYWRELIELKIELVIT